MKQFEPTSVPDSQHAAVDRVLVAIEKVESILVPRQNIVCTS